MASEDALMRRSAVVSLTTDFGLKDAYVGVMKAVILSRLPAVQLVDLCHEVAPQAVLEAAFLLETAWPHFPDGSVHVSVVDPGVGTARRRIALTAGGHLFVGPDNGCLSPALPPDARRRRASGEAYAPDAVALPAGVLAVSIENESILRRPVSATFEGRDVFVPAAAHLAGGGSLADLGPAIDRLQAFPMFRAPATMASLDGRVLRIDRFGNLITDVYSADLQSKPRFRVCGQRLRLTPSYAAADGLCAIEGSSGFIEIALPNGNAAAVLHSGSGDQVSVTWQ